MQGIDVYVLGILIECRCGHIVRLEERNGLQDTGDIDPVDRATRTANVAYHRIKKIQLIGTRDVQGAARREQAALCKPSGGCREEVPAGPCQGTDGTPSITGSEQGGRAASGMMARQGLAFDQADSRGVG